MRPSRATQTGRCVLQKNRIGRGRELGGDAEADRAGGVADRAQDLRPGKVEPEAAMRRREKQRRDEAAGARDGERGPGDRLDQQAAQAPEKRRQHQLADGARMGGALQLPRAFSTVPGVSTSGRMTGSLLPGNQMRLNGTALRWNFASSAVIDGSRFVQSPRRAATCRS